MLAHQDLVQSIALALKNTLFLYAELDDLIGAGNEGLLEAATSYDPASTASFATYARPCIRGYILNSTSKWYQQSLTHKPISDIANSERHSTKPDLRKIDLRAARAHLTVQQRTVVAYYYDHDWSMPQIAESMGLTTARVSQIHKQAIALLRVHLS